MKTSPASSNSRTSTPIKTGAKKLKKKLGRILGSKVGRKQGKRAKNEYFVPTSLTLEGLTFSEPPKPLEIRAPQVSEVASIKKPEPEEPAYDFRTSPEYKTRRHRHAVYHPEPPNTGPDQRPQATPKHINTEWVDFFGGQVVKGNQTNDNTPKGNT